MDHSRSPSIAPTRRRPTPGRTRRTPSRGHSLHATRGVGFRAASKPHERCASSGGVLSLPCARRVTPRRSPSAPRVVVRGGRDRVLGDGAAAARRPAPRRAAAPDVRLRARADVRPGLLRPRLAAQPRLLRAHRAATARRHRAGRARDRRLGDGARVRRRRAVRRRAAQRLSGPPLPERDAGRKSCAAVRRCGRCVAPRLHGLLRHGADACALHRRTLRRRADDARSGVLTSPRDRSG